MAFYNPLEVLGNWDFVNNIAQSVGQPLSTSPSGFFPTPQREKMISETVEPAGSAGWTYRPLAPQQQSIYETAKWAADDWLRSPFEAQLAIPAKIQESKALEEKISGITSQRGILEGIIGAVGRAGEISQQFRTVVDEIGGAWGVWERPVIEERPRAGAPEGQNLQHLNRDEDDRADVVTMARGLFGGILEQVKGLFNLGFPQTGSQPAFAIKHEVEPSQRTMIIAGVAVGAILLVILLRGRK